MISIVSFLPVARPDLHLAIKFLRWVVALRRMEYSHYDLVVMAAASVLPEEMKRLRDECSMTNNFRLVQQREIHEHPELGYGAAANFLFREALETAEREFPSRPMLWNEADTVPIRPTWMQDISDEYAACGKPFMGAFHASGPIPHMSGNAVYGANWRQLSPCLAALPGPRPQQGWDSACAHELVPQMAISKTIQQVWITPPFAEHNVDRFLKPETALFHRCKDGTLIDVLAARLNLVPIPLEAPLCEPTSIMGKPINRSPKVAILIVTFARDMEFLRYCLKSIKLYASGFAGVTVVVPSHERGLYDWVKPREATVKYFDEPEGKGMLSHMIQKCRADEWCQDVDFVLHLDADCMFFRKVTPAAYVQDWRCLSVREAYAGITNPHRHTWRENVKSATGIVPAWDFMLRHPQIHPVSTYRATREMVESYTGVGFDEYVLSGQNIFPQSFCEHGTLGAVGRHLFACCYSYVDYDKAADAAMIGQEEGSFQYVYRRETDYAVEWWSHAGIERYRANCEAILAGRIPAYWIK